MQNSEHRINKIPQSFANGIFMIFSPSPPSIYSAFQEIASCQSKSLADGLSSVPVFLLCAIFRTLSYLEYSNTSLTIYSLFSCSEYQASAFNFSLYKNKGKDLICAPLSMQIQPFGLVLDGIN